MIRRFIDELTSGDRGTALTKHHANRWAHRCRLGTTVVPRWATAAHRRHAVIRSMAVAAIIVVASAGPRMSRRTSRDAVRARSSVAVWRVPWLPPPGSEAVGAGPDLPGFIMARPVVALAITSAVLLAVAVPCARTADRQRRRLGSAGEFVGPPRLTTWSSSSSAGHGQPIQVVLESNQPFSGAGDFAHIAALTADLSRLTMSHASHRRSPFWKQYCLPTRSVRSNPRLSKVCPADSQTIIDHFRSADRKTIAIDVFSNGACRKTPTVNTLLSAVRAVAKSNAAPSWQVSRRGFGRRAVLSQPHISDAGPLVIATMLAVIYLLLVLTFRSLLLPLKASH